MDNVLSGRNTSKFTLKLASWNVRTLQDQTNDPNSRPSRRTALIANELKRYDVDIAALSETRFPDEDSITEVGEGYTYFWRGLTKEEPRIHGVGFAVKTKLMARLPEGPTGINERLMTWRIPLKKNRYLTIISAYAPTLVTDELTKDTFYSALDATLQNIPNADKVVLMGDFNARVGKNWQLWDGALGRHGTGNMNSNGLRLLTLCAEHGLVLTNTLFQQKDKYKNTWQHPRSGHWHMLDYIITRKTHISDVRITRVMRGAECWTDHRLVRAHFRFQIRPPTQRQAPRRKLNCGALKDPETRNSYRACIASHIPAVTSERGTPDEEWEKTCMMIQDSAKETIGFKRRNHADWFDENNEAIHQLLQDKRKAHDASLANPQSTYLAQRWKDLRTEAQRKIRELENKWWIDKAQEIQAYADTNNMQGFYNALKSIHGPRKNTLSPLRSADGLSILKERSDILNRWAEHFQSLLNHQNPYNEDILEGLAQSPIVHDLSTPPQMHEVICAIKNLKDNKSCGPDEIPGELLKYGGYLLKQHLHKLILALWEEERIPKIWIDATIIPIYKNKGEKSDCNNSRGIFLLSVAGKVLARIILSRLVSHVSELVLPETQCGFRKERGTIDMVFSLRQIQEKCIEQNKDLFIVFVDLTKAFDTVPRELLWKILLKYGVPEKFLNLIKLFHAGMEAKVSVCGKESPPFPVEVGVKQGDVLAPVLFNLFTSVVMKLLQASLIEEDGVYLEYRLDGNLFNIRRLQAHTKTTTLRLLDLQYADDAALVTHSAVSMQRILDTLSSIYQAFGLQINTRKTEILMQLTDQNQNQDVPEFHIQGARLQVVPFFKYLGSIVSSSSKIDNDVIDKINKASRAFGSLRSKVFSNKHLKLSTKIQVYEAVCISSLLYGAETWTIYRRHLAQLEHFHISCLQKILGLTWKDRITHTQIFDRTNTTSIEAIITKRQLRWLGHVIRMPDERLPRQILYGQLQDSLRRSGGPKKRYKDQAKTTLKKCTIPPSDLEALANNRSAWKAKIKEGVAILEESRKAQRARKRQRRHANRGAPAAPNPQWTCPTCGRMCSSRIGLVSHTNAHRRRELHPR